MSDHLKCRHMHPISPLEYFLCKMVLLAFERRSLHDLERRYPMHEKEMIVLVDFVQAWMHYLLGKLFVVKIYNIAMGYFATQSKFSPK